MTKRRGEFTPVSPDALAGAIAQRVPRGVARVAIDGPPCARPDTVADAVAESLRGVRPTAHIRAATFWRDASVRLDGEALRREVLDPVVTSGWYLPSLRAPRTNRSTREPARQVQPNTAVIVSGTFLLGRDLPFDLTVHLAVSPAARARQTSDEDAWTLAADAQYDDSVRPADVADIVVRYDDSRHPAIRT